MKSTDAYFACPHCGAPVKSTAKSCPHCGSDSSTGWSDGAEFSDLDLPDYDEIVENEMGKPKKQSPFVIIAAVIVVIAFAAVFTLSHI